MLSSSEFSYSASCLPVHIQTIRKLRKKSNQRSPYVLKGPSDDYLVSTVSKAWNSFSSGPVFFSGPVSRASFSQNVSKIVIRQDYSNVWLLMRSDQILAAINYQCEVVERAEGGWKNCSGSQKLGLKERKWNRNWEKDFAAPGSRFCCISTLCRPEPTWPCRSC